MTEATAGKKNTVFMSRPPRRSIVEALVLALLIFLAAASLVIVVAMSWNRVFHVDEVGAIHAAYNIRSGDLIYKDFQTNDPPLLHAILSMVIDKDQPAGSFRRARLVSLLVLLSTIFITFIVARRLGGNLTALLSAGLLLLHSTFVERGMEVRADGAIGMCTMLALLLSTSRQGTLRRFSMQAILLGSSLLLGQKAMLPLLFFCGLWLIHARRQRRALLALLPLGITLLPLAGLLCLFAVQGNAGGFLEMYFGPLRPAEISVHVEHSFSPKYSLLTEMARNRFFVLVTLVALGACLAAMIKNRRSLLSWGLAASLIALFLDPFPAMFFLVAGVAISSFVILTCAPTAMNVERMRLPFILGIFLIASLWLNPHPHPNNHVILIPPMSLLASIFLTHVHAWLSSRSERLMAMLLLLACLGLAGVTSLPRILEQTRLANHTQLNTLEEIQRITGADDRIFDMAGLYFRPDAYPIFAMDYCTMKQYTNGRFPRITATLRKNQVVAIVQSFRTNWLTDEERRFLHDHFIQYAGNILLMGQELNDFKAGQRHLFEVLKEKRFRYEGPPGLRMDGRTFYHGRLKKGVHTLTADRDIPRGKLIMDTPAPFPIQLGDMALIYPTYR